MSLLVVVTGPPASGKTTLARSLAGELGLPWIGKDVLKEQLYDVLGSGEELEPRLEDAARRLLLTVAEAQLAAGLSAIVESNFDRDSDLEPLQRVWRDHHDTQVVQIHCSADVELLLARFSERAASGARHPGHGDEPEDAEDVRRDLERGRWDPLDLPGELIEVDLGGDVDVAAVAARIRATATG
ncbi:MAG TPA: ATP-binding protein [Gaiellaceae bacterium]